ncbi:putative tetratricopeptide-like helical protein [Rosellinia necatrix]|uniref:Putative tetratricopeptide-like helical protein n=1 Tax=Rosellinia necatrix TaxID=77044 RepID=A0A1W2TSK1_ROSNE|nr:putative tetratricopeptide-like helical protein [Rosellinia necatrix]
MKLAIIPARFVFLHHKVDIGILLLNHQIYRHAVDVLVKRNQFVRLVVRGLHVDSVLMPRQVPVVAQGAATVDAFKGYVMSHLIELPDDESFVHHFMILGRDLDLFCEALAGCGMARFGAHSMHRVTIHNPFADTPTPNYLDVTNQASYAPFVKRAAPLERLLRPYRKHLRGFPWFEVVGNVHPDLAAAIKQEVKQDPIKDPQDLLRDSLEQKALGKRYFDEGDYKMASETWDGALVRLDQLVHSDAWPRVKAEAPDRWSEGLTEVFFQLGSNLAANTLRIMRQTAHAHADPAMARHYASSLCTVAVGAAAAARVFGTDWEPTPVQTAKLSYRMARVDITIAEYSINLAARYLPNDPSIQQERCNIARWRAEGA